MQIREYLENVCEYIKYKPIRKEISDELENHIEEIKESYILQGIPELKAEEKAIEQMGKAENIGKELNKIHKPKLDWKLVLIVVVLLIFGFLIANIRQTSTIQIGIAGTNQTIETAIGECSIIKFIGFTIIGIILGTLMYFFDYRKIIKYSNSIYMVAILIIIATFIPGMNTIMNGKRYLVFIKSFTPSTVVLPLYVISFVGFIMNIHKKDLIQERINIENITVVNKFKIAILSLISIISLIWLNSITSAIILLITYLSISTIYIILNKDNGNKIKKVILLWIVPVIIATLLCIYGSFFSSFRFDRIKSFINYEQDPNGSGYLNMQIKTILNSANLYGKSNDMGYGMNIFEEGTNFAFITILAHYGWIVAGTMLVAILIMLVKLIINSKKIRDMGGKLLTISISIIFILQCLCNLLMNVNLGIIADFNIPFISYGGINLIVNMVCLGFIMGIYRRKDIMSLN